MTTKELAESVGLSTAIILAGGKSIRLGRDKVHMEFSGSTLLERAVEDLRFYFSEVIVATNVHEIGIPGVTVVRDEIPHTGPMGGILAGLEKARSDLALVRAVDMPFISEELVRLLAGEIDEGYDAFVCETERGLEPLFAVYRKSLIPLMRERVAEGNTALVEFFKAIKIKQITKDKLLIADPEGLSFMNINNDKDLISAIAVLKERGRN